MSGISTGVGLISGLPTADLIAQLIALERRPITLLQTRVAGIQTQRTAWADLSARLLSAKAVASRLGELNTFRRFETTSSNEDVLTATAAENAAPGTYRLTVQSLVTSHQVIGRGLADADTTPVGAGTLSIEIGHGRVNPTTTLDQLNGYQGVRRGTIRITDRHGDFVDLDLSTAVTLDDVIDRINAQTAVRVKARIVEDHLVIEDLNDPAAVVGNLSVADVGGGSMAADLGLAQNVSGSTLTSKDLIYLTGSTRLDVLNDGNGVRHHVVGGDFRITQANGHAFEVSLSADLARNPATYLAQLNSGNGIRLGTIRITDRSGAKADIDLTGAQTVQDVRYAINNAGIGVEVTVGRGYLQINDVTGTPAGVAVNLKVEDVTGYAARDLGLLCDVAANGYVGKEVFRISTVGDVVRAINYAPGNDGPDQRVIAALSPDGNGLVLTDESIGAGPLKVEALELNGALSSAATDLGILGEFEGGTTARRDLLAGLDTVLLTSLNGGRGITRKGVVRFTAGDGTATEINFGNAQTLQEVIEQINTTSATSKVAAAVNRAGNGIVLTDTSGGTGSLTIADLDGGTLAQQLGIAGTHATSSVNGGNLQLKYVAENTRLADLNYGTGVGLGEFQITDSKGLVTRVKITENQTSLADVMDLINAGPVEVTARVNDTGDGLLITDHAGGTGLLSIVDLNGGSTAADLRIAGRAAAGNTTIDGSYEIRVDVDADDTLNDVRTKLNTATSQVRASVLHDGSANGYRLTLTSQISGRRGELVLDTGQTGLVMDTLVRAQDAVVLFGGTDEQQRVMITSSTNTLINVIPNVTIDLTGTSQDPVTLSVSHSVDNVVSDLDTLVTTFNAVLDRIAGYTKFDPETLERGALLGNSTVQRVESRLYGAVTRAYANVPVNLSRLLALGVTVASGGRLQFNESKFREVYESDPESVERFFTTAESGLGPYLEQALDDLTRTEDGVISKADNLLADHTDLLNERIATLEELVARKQARLEAQFAALEEALATLQSQQTALAGLSQIQNTSRA